jgi:hypothetical protein
LERRESINTPPQCKNRVRTGAHSMDVSRWFKMFHEKKHCGSVKNSVKPTDGTSPVA